MPALVATLLLTQAATSSYSTTSVMQSAISVADEYHLNKEHFLATLNCESGFRFNIKGDDGFSVGVAQINLKAHPDVMLWQALDPQWSLVWMAKQWRAGNAHIWSCWRILRFK